MQAGPNLTDSGSPPPKNLRSLSANSMSEKASWAAFTPFNDIFDGGQNRHDPLQMPKVKVTAGMTRFAELKINLQVNYFGKMMKLIEIRTI